MFTVISIRFSLIYKFERYTLEKLVICFSIVYRLYTHLGLYKESVSYKIHVPDLTCKTNIAYTTGILGQNLLSASLKARSNQLNIISIHAEVQFSSSIN